MKTSRHEKCLICSSTKLHQLSRYYEKHRLVKCRSCGFVFMEKIPTIDELTLFYSNYSYDSDSPLSPLTKESYNLLLDKFEKFRKTNKILDVGCGRGWFLIEAKKRGWEVYGTEFSEKAIEVCEASGLNMKMGKLENNTFSQGVFDIITSFEVIEHINNPLEEIANIHRFLRKGGLFYCTTPNFNAYLRYYLRENYNNVIVYPEHLSYYTRSTLKKLMRVNNFNTQRVLTTGVSISSIKMSKLPGSEQPTSSDSSDEKLRNKISSSWYLRAIKKFVNSTLSIFGVGITLKGYFIKP
jgi:2-polyprenyl-3-methyl-5-hydroxy-6-metoxy-1,4-benzoquinol methylase